MLEAVLVALQRLPLPVLLLAVQEEPRGVVAEGPPRPRHEVDAVVGAGAHHVVLEHDGPAFRSLDEARVHVPRIVSFLLTGVALRDPERKVPAEAALGRAHGDDALEAVSAIDVHVARHRAEAVSGVQVSIPLEMFEPAPEAFALLREQDPAQVVNVGGLAVDDVSQESGLHHVEHEHLVVSVAAVLEHDAVPAAPLGSLHQRPALFDRVGRRHLDPRMLAGVERGHRHRHVPVPRGRDVHEVEVVTAAEVLEVVVPLVVACGTRLALSMGEGLRGSNLLGDDVADGLDLHLVDGKEVAEQARPAAAHTDDADPDHVAGLEPHADDGLAPGRRINGGGRGGRARREEGVGESQASRGGSCGLEQTTS